MLTPADQDKLAYAKSLVDHFSTAELTAITRATARDEYPREFRGFSPRRIGVYKRAALIVLNRSADEIYIPRCRAVCHGGLPTNRGDVGLIGNLV